MVAGHPSTARSSHYGFLVTVGIRDGGARQLARVARCLARRMGLF